MINNTPIHLYGITNVYYTPTFDLLNEFELDNNTYQYFTCSGIDLSLCGDTHGGQFRPPFIGAVLVEYFRIYLSNTQRGCIKRMAVFCIFQADWAIILCRLD